MHPPDWLSYEPTSLFSYWARLPNSYALRRYDSCSRARSSSHERPLAVPPDTLCVVPTELNFLRPLGPRMSQRPVPFPRARKPSRHPATLWYPATYGNQAPTNIVFFSRHRQSSRVPLLRRLKSGRPGLSGCQETKRLLLSSNVWHGTRRAVRSPGAQRPLTLDIYRTAVIKFSTKVRLYCNV